MIDQTDSEWLESVVGGARNPINWLSTADQLLQCADALDRLGDEARQQHFSNSVRMVAMLFTDMEPAAQAELDKQFDMSMGCGRVAMMLKGCAVENLIKGILISRDPERWAKKADQIFKWNHDIARLASDARVELTEVELELADRLTLFIEWGGRYPTARTAADHPRTGASWSTEDRPVIERLIVRLRETLGNEIQRVST